MLDTTAHPVPGVAYVLSTGRSGSTLLEMRMARDLDMQTVGEVQLLGYELAEEGYVCSCGVPTRQCPYWQQVAAGLPSDLNAAGLALFRPAHNRGRTLRAGDLWRIAMRRPLSATGRAYVDLNTRLFAQVAAVAEAETHRPTPWIVDASKDPYRCASLTMGYPAPVRIVHLIRSAPGFVHSQTKGVAKPKTGLRRRLLVARTALRWRVANAVYALVASRGEGAVVWYEDLAQDPAGVVARLARTLGLPMRASLNPNTQPHAIAGSRRRAEAGAVQLDDAWKTGLDPWDQWIVRRICGGLEARLRRKQGGLVS